MVLSCLRDPSYSPDTSPQQQRQQQQRQQEDTSHRQRLVLARMPIRTWDRAWVRIGIITNTRATIVTKMSMIMIMTVMIRTLVLFLSLPLALSLFRGYMRVRVWRKGQGQDQREEYLSLGEFSGECNYQLSTNTPLSTHIIKSLALYVSYLILSLTLFITISIYHS